MAAAIEKYDTILKYVFKKGDHPEIANLTSTMKVGLHLSVVLRF